MNKHQQSGMTTLLITSMLLIVALLFSLASYKNLFYQIKRTQNEVLARQAHWAAEGGLECGFAQIQKAGNISDAKPTFIDCESLLNLVDVDVDVDDNYIKSEYDNISNKLVKKKIKLSSRLAGAIQARSDLKLIGDYDISPDVEGKHNNGDYKCVAIRYSNRFIFDKTEPGNSGTELEVMDPIENGPYSGFNGKCAEGYRSHLKVTTDSFNDATKNNLEKDFVYDPDFDPFESFFGDKRSELEQIRKEFVQISGSIESAGSNNTCTKKIKAAFDSIKNKDKKVWVTGDCDLGGDNSLSLDLDPKVLVIENGIIATWASVLFTGSVYHLIDPTIYPVSNLTSKWNEMPTKDQFSTLVKANSVYIDGGSFNTTGGMVFDTPGGLTTMIAGMVLSYDRGTNPLPINNKITWQQGSWHDF
ncbi:hypothetical protein GLP37_07110 [Photobacterium phosphoreum]|uniref:hypothetical protein n=1 Tax=Photobacterium phosphoreum TaxID=659 RepID=UPI001E563CDD|nr:hypothetical protein [Photobacterium phosphoreum]MCD9501941.1 hypothetical protein [Photobacterium phosphoreum]